MTFMYFIFIAMFWLLRVFALNIPKTSFSQEFIVQLVAFYINNSSVSSTYILKLPLKLRNVTQILLMGVEIF